MRPAVAFARRALRCCLAVSFALSWLLVAGTPAAAAVTRVYVTTPQPDAVLTKASRLDVLVDRTASPENESVTIQTRMMDAEGKLLSKKILDVAFDKQLPPRDDQPPESDRLRFRGIIDAYNLPWLPKGGVAPNAKYQLQYRAITKLGEDATTEGDWQTTAFWLNAPPPPQGAPAARVADAAAKRLQVAWRPNLAPDLVSYTLERRRDGGKWQVAQAEVKPGTTQITDTVAAFGSYRYRVVAFRPAAEPKTEETQQEQVDSAAAEQGSEAPEEQEQEKEPVKLQSRVSARSAAVALSAPASPAPPGSTANDGDDTGRTGGSGRTGGGGTSSGSTSTGTVPQVPSAGSSGSSGQVASQPFNPQSPNLSPPAGFEDTYKGPLDFGVDAPSQVTERVPVEIAEGGSSGGDETLTVLERAIDQQRVLPPVAGGLILVVSAGHVLRYLNE